MKRIIAISTLIFNLTAAAVGQNLAVLNKDSLLRLLPAANEDSAKVLLLIKVGNAYERSKPDSAASYYKAAGELSSKIGWPSGTLKYISNYTAVLNMQDKYDQSLPLNLQAIDLAKKGNDDLQLACAYGNTAASYYGLNNYEPAIDYFLKATSLLEKLKDKGRLVLSYGNLAGILNELNEYDRAYAYGLKSIKLSRELNDKYTLEEALVNTSNTISSLGKKDSALLLLQQADLLAAELDDRLTRLTVSADMADIYREQGNYAEMKTYSDECLRLSQELGNKEGAALSYLNIGYYAFFKKDFITAKANEEKALALATGENLPQALQKCYLFAGDIALATGDLRNFKKFRALKDSMQNISINDKVLKNSRELEAKYSLDKKQSDIDRLNKETEIRELTLSRRNTLNLVLAAAVAILLLLAFLYHKTNLQNKKLLDARAGLQQQRITELEKEKQLSAARSMLQGQEEERKRLAKDLHDGLGGILSGTKYAFSHMKNNMALTGENADAFDRSMAMLDHSISEMRRVSHNMMPEALVKFGLDTALRDYCNSISQPGSVQFSYQSFGLTDNSVQPAKASVIYRIIQELTNNILKHAAAENALVQLIFARQSLSITVEDDGTGLDPAVLVAGKGIGLSNLQNRVTYLKGAMDIKAAPREGVSVHIEIPGINI